MRDRERLNRGAKPWRRNTPESRKALMEARLELEAEELEEAIEVACEVMHDAYEKAALGAGWETQESSRKPWPEVPEANKEAMRAAVRALLEHIEARG